MIEPRLDKEVRFSMTMKGKIACSCYTCTREIRVFCNIDSLAIQNWIMLVSWRNSCWKKDQLCLIFVRFGFLFSFRRERKKLDLIAWMCDIFKWYDRVTWVNRLAYDIFTYVDTYGLKYGILMWYSLIAICEQCFLCYCSYRVIESGAPLKSPRKLIYTVYTTCKLHMKFSFIILKFILFKIVSLFKIYFKNFQNFWGY